MTGPGQPRICSHSINAQMLTEVFQVVRMFSPCHLHVYVSIGTLESDVFSKYSMWNQMDKLQSHLRTTPKYSSKIFTLDQCLITVYYHDRDSTVHVQIHVIMVWANYAFYN